MYFRGKKFKKKMNPIGRVRYEWRSVGIIPLLRPKKQQWNADEGKKGDELQGILPNKWKAQVMGRDIPINVNSRPFTAKTVNFCTLLISMAIRCGFFLSLGQAWERFFVECLCWKGWVYNKSTFNKFFIFYGEGCFKNSWTVKKVIVKIRFFWCSLLIRRRM
jgi:hypothetical protein